MKKVYITTKIMALALLIAYPFTQVDAAQAPSDEKLVMVYYDNGRLDVFPEAVVESRENVRGQLRITTVSDTSFYYNLSRVDSVVVRTKDEINGRLASITQLKFNNKYNDQVYSDVFAEIEQDSIITASIGAIGKWLTPSFQLSDENARLYIGHERQESKKSRRSYANDVYYTVAQPNQRLFAQKLVKEAVWSDPVGEFSETQVALNAGMFSTNLPGQTGEGFEQMLDGNIGTIFHSTWNISDAEEKARVIATHPYLNIALPESMRYIRFGYTTRTTGQYWPVSMTLSASNDGQNWTEIKTLTTADGLPAGAGAEFLSDVIDLGQNYRHLRLFLNEIGRSDRFYMVFAEFQLKKAVRNANPHDAEIIEPAEYRYQMEPFGRNYRVHIDWLADKAENVPTVNIDVEGRLMITSKDYYLDADITIDGGGVFPSMEATPMHIKGRGNSSWQGYSYYYDDYQPVDYGYAYKNPYRIKFDEKHKPFGLTNGKNWVLLANKIGGSMLSNAIGMKVACLVGTVAANHIVPVELYINGYYYGNYNFTEKVGLSNNSVELDDESRATFLELDTYFDEPNRFRSNPYSLPVNIKEPENFNDETTTLLTKDDIVLDFNAFMQALKDKEDISDYVDIESLARFLMVNELILNHELKHPKSTFLYNPSVGTEESKFFFGPVWDLDWAFGYEDSYSTSRTYFQVGATTDYYTSTTMAAKSFIHDLRFVSEKLDREYYAVWKRFMEHQLEELIEFCDDYYAYARPSLEHNANGGSYNVYDGTDYQRSTENAKKWLRQRANFIYSNLTTYDVPDDDPIIDNFDDEGDVSGVEINTKEEPERTQVDVYDINGRLVKRGVSVFDLRTGLKPGIYIVNGKKMVIK